MMSKYKTFIATAVNRFDQTQKPNVTVFSDPLNPGKYIACFNNMDCDELVNGYNYDELLSIRNAINEALTNIDVCESVAEYNSRNPGLDSFRD